MKTRTILAAILTLTACKDSGSNKKERAPTPSVNPSVATQVKPTPTPTPETKSDHITISISHAKPKEGDPVIVKFEKFDITSATFDPANIEGAIASVDVEIASVNSENKDRDKHLVSPDFFDAATHPKATVDVSEVKKKSDQRYSAKLAVTIHGVKNAWPVEFDLVETTDSTATIELDHNFKRSDFKMMTEGPADDVNLKARMTFTQMK